MTGRRAQLRLNFVTAVAAAMSVAAACTAVPMPAPTPMPTPSATPAATTTIEVKTPTGIDYLALETELKRRLAAGPKTLKEVRSVLISIDGTTELAFDQGSKATDHRHVWSVTKSVLSILVGIAVDEGKLRLDQPLAELLPEHASVMTDDQKATTLRQLLTMTGGMAGDGGGLNPEAEDPIAQLLTYSAPGARGRLRLLRLQRPPGGGGAARGGRAVAPGLRAREAVRPTRDRLRARLGGLSTGT